MKTRMCAALLCPLLSWTSLAAAQEFEVLGTHPLRGRLDGRGYEGRITFEDGGRYRIERFEDGLTIVEAGSTTLRGRDIVLTRAPSLIERLRHKSSERRFVRADGKGRARFRVRSGDDWEGFSLGKKKSRSEQAWRAIHRGHYWQYLLQRNRGWVDRSYDVWIQRSKQPSAKDIARFAEASGRTVISLNGRQKAEVRAAIKANDLSHHVFNLRKGRAPTEAELVKVFKVLLDEEARPILLHCDDGADRTGLIAALYRIEILGWDTTRARSEMEAHLARATHMFVALDLHQPGRLTGLLERAGLDTDGDPGTPPLTLTTDLRDGARD